ncbi:MAG: transporter [Cyanobacteria bacterium K_Offshore_surface_m2_239]|nr:transporter [Cyanobacteria bacterium K_Offshore_surface_m2_239]
MLLLIKISLISLMIALGLQLRPHQLMAQQRRPWLVLRVVLGSCVLVPLVALLLLKLPWALQLSPGARLGIALMALSPSAPLTLRKAGAKGGDANLAAVLQVVAALLAVVSIPLLSDLFRAVFQVRGWDLRPGPVALQVGLVQVLPLSVGLLLGRWKPELGARWAAPMQSIALGINLTVVGIILVQVLPKLSAFLARNPLVIPAMAAMTAAALALGYGLGGADRNERLTCAVVTSMRNPGLALLFAASHGSTVPGLKLAIVTYLLVTLLGSIPFLRWANRPTHA